MTPPALSVVLPAWAEADNLRVLLPALDAALSRLQVPYEVLVVDAEPSRDDTAAVCAAAGARRIGREGGDTYGDAVRTGIAASTGAWVLFMDADGSHPADVVASLWEARADADLVIASRYVRGGGSHNPPRLVLQSRLLNLVFRVGLGLPVSDVSNSLRLYRGADLRRLRPESDHFDVVEELLARLAWTHPGYRVHEVPFTFRTRHAGTTKRDLSALTSGYVATLRRLRRLRRTLERGSA